MSDLHRLGYAASQKQSLEGVSPSFIREKLLEARQKSWDVYRQIREEIREGMTEDEGRKLALRVFEDHGVKKHWHRPFVRFGAGTALTFFDPVQPDYRLKAGDPVYIDLGPVWPDVEQGLEYEGDVGDSFCMGENAAAQQCIVAARDLFEEGRTAWKANDLSGRQIYSLLEKGAQKRGYSLTTGVEGHRIGDFPHHHFSKAGVGQLEFTPASDLWILEVHLKLPDQSLGAFFEDIL